MHVSFNNFNLENYEPTRHLFDTNKAAAPESYSRALHVVLHR